MSEEDLNLDENKKLKELSESNGRKPLNKIFKCSKCNRISLLIPSNISNKIIKFCGIEKMAEVISLTDLKYMKNIKPPKKRDSSKEPIIKKDNLSSDEFICPLHAKHFINYCGDCSKDICYTCSKEHINHNLVFFSKFLPTKRDIREGNKILSEMKNDLKKFIQNSNDIIKSCENLISIKEEILKALNSVDLERINFYSIMNCKNMLKIKIQLNDKLYNIINPLTKENSNLLKSIKYNYEKQIKLFSTKDSSGTDFFNKTFLYQKDFNQINKINIFNNFDLYQKFEEILKNTYEFGDEKNNNKFVKDIKVSTDPKTKKSKMLENNIYDIHIHQKNVLNLQIKSNLSIPIVNKFEQNNNANKNKNKTNIIENNDNKDNKDNKDNESLEECNYVKEIHLDKDQDDEIIEKEPSKSPKNPYISEYDKSSIMNDKEIYDIINLVSKKLNKKVKKLYLCYRATKDGDKAENFHKKCDYIVDTIILIQTKKNKKFGGFSTQSWDISTEQMWKKDNQAFIFSLNKYENKCYGIVNSERALFCHKKCGPIFGNGEIFVPDNFFTNVSTCLKYNTVYESKEHIFPLNGEKEFYIKDMEAYKIDFEQ